MASPSNKNYNEYNGNNIINDNNSDYNSDNNMDSNYNNNINLSLPKSKSIGSGSVHSNNSNNSSIYGDVNIDSIIKQLRTLKQIRLSKKIKNGTNNNSSNNNVNKIPTRLEQAFKGSNTIVSPRMDPNESKYIYNTYTNSNEERKYNSGNRNNNSNNDNEINILKMQILKQEEQIKSLQYKLMSKQSHLPSLSESNSNTPNIFKQLSINNFKSHNKFDSKHIRQKSLSQIVKYILISSLGIYINILLIYCIHM